MKKNIFFPKRIPEPKIMESVEQNIFAKVSKENYKKWIIPLADDILKYSGIKKGGILDVACGPGLLTKELAKRLPGFKVIGLDSSTPALKIARGNCKTLKNVAFQKSDVQKMPFPDASFEIVVCKDSLHHFDNVNAALR